MKTIAVLILDIHFSLPTLKLANAATLQAVEKANDLEIPVIIPGDIHDTKANLRGECVNAMLSSLSNCVFTPAVLVGNHDKINEKSEDHSLNFLREAAIIVDSPQELHEGTYAIPYQHDSDVLRAYLKTITKGSTLIMHQGLQGSHMGDYIQDKSAINPEDVAGFRVISGHYHARQTINLPDGGKWDYVGNPYTVSFGEANDPPKGFQILYDDGSLEFVPTNLRKHIIVDFNANDFDPNENGTADAGPGDLVWVKIKGTHEELNKITRAKVKEYFNLETFKLDLIPTGGITEKPTKQLGSTELMDSLIDSLTETSDERKLRLKELWRHLGS